MKRRSITRRPDLTLFTDEDTGFCQHHCLPKILIEAGLKVECLGDHFPRSTPDHEWLQFCGERGWIGVTHDKSIRRDERSMVALAQGGAQVVTLIGVWTHTELGTNFVNSIFVIERHLKREPAPCLVKLHMATPQNRERGRSGKVEVYRTKGEIMDEVGHLIAPPDHRP